MVIYLVVIIQCYKEDAFNIMWNCFLLFDQYTKADGPVWSFVITCWNVSQKCLKAAIEKKTRIMFIQGDATIWLTLQSSHIWKLLWLFLKCMKYLFKEKHSNLSGKV